MILVFAILCVGIHFGIQIFREFTYKEKLSAVRTAAYSVLIAAIATVLLLGLVILF